MKNLLYSILFSLFLSGLANAGQVIFDGKNYGNFKAVELDASGNLIISSGAGNNNGGGAGNCSSVPSNVQVDKTWDFNNPGSQSLYALAEVPRLGR